MFGLGRRSECAQVKELLSPYFDRRLGAREQAQVEAHLARCVACRAELESLRATIELLHNLSSVPVPHSFALREAPQPRGATGWTILVSPLRYATAVATVLLLALFLGDVLGWLPPAMPPTAELPVPTSAAPALPTAPSVPTAAPVPAAPAPPAPTAVSTPPPRVPMMAAARAAATPTPVAPQVLEKEVAVSEPTVVAPKALGVTVDEPAAEKAPSPADSSLTARAPLPKEERARPLAQIELGLLGLVTLLGAATAVATWQSQRKGDHS